MQSSKAVTRAPENYFFVSHWRVPGTTEQVFRLLQQVERLPQWWPSVYLHVDLLDAREAELLTKGWLPYRLKWKLRVTELNFPSRISLDALGDLEGHGTWHLAQDGDFVDITYDWEVVANKPLLKRLSPIFKPIFALNHRWAMKQGETSLKLELQRLRAANMEEALKVPAPPGPEPSLQTLALLAGGLLSLLTTLLVWLRLRKKAGKE